jgi:hypothetical protein
MKNTGSWHLAEIVCNSKGQFTAISAKLVSRYSAPSQIRFSVKIIYNYELWGFFT